jgi:hypothetical protein
MIFLRRFLVEYLVNFRKCPRAVYLHPQEEFIVCGNYCRSSQIWRGEIEVALLSGLKTFCIFSLHREREWTEPLLYDLFNLNFLDNPKILLFAIFTSPKIDRAARHVLFMSVIFNVIFISLLHLPLGARRCWSTLLAFHDPCFMQLSF